MNSQRLNPFDPIKNLSVGTLIEVDGTHIVAEIHKEVSELTRIYEGDVYSIGQFGSIIKIHFGKKLIYAYVSRLIMRYEYELEKGFNPSKVSDSRIIEADLFGEAEWILQRSEGKENWLLHFERGVSTFPLPQQQIYLTPKRELLSIFGQERSNTINIGEHVGSAGAPCFIDLNELLGKHTAILGSTGSGKSATVAAILHRILSVGNDRGHKVWNPRIIILDPHNEYSKSFAGNCDVFSTDSGNLQLPYWLLNFDETRSLLIGKTEFAATSQSNIVKSALYEARIQAARTLKLDVDGLTVDSPIPYSLALFKKHIEDDKQKLAPSKQDSHNSILEKLSILEKDARLSFVMKPWLGEKDEFGQVFSQIIGSGKPVKIIDLSGIPNEIAGITSSAIARLLFSLKIWQSPIDRESSPVLLVCEEAHRYVPNVGEAQYEGAQEAIKRLAKEGRKYGIGLFLVSQRPSEIEATVLSQCNSWVILRITNEKDRDHVKSVLPDSLSGLTKLLSGLRRREALVVGQAVTIPSRVLIEKLPKEKLPDSGDIDFEAGWQKEYLTEKELNIIAKRWRYQSLAEEEDPPKK